MDDNAELENQSSDGNIEYTPSGRFNMGFLSGREYTKPYFGFSLEIPFEWEIIDEDELVQYSKDFESNKSFDDSKLAGIHFYHLKTIRRNIGSFLEPKNLNLYLM